MKRRINISKIEWLTFLISMPFLAVLLNYFLFGNRLFSDYKVWLFSWPLIYVQGCLLWYVHMAVMHNLRIRFPDIRQTAQRLIFLSVAHMSLIVLSFISLFYIYDRLHFLHYHLEVAQLKYALYTGIAFTMIATTMWEADYTFRQWKLTLAEKERLEQLTIQHEFNTLKSQVNPHFLFNCFNTLSSLISEDRKQAELFLNELSKVYRYLLRNNESSLTTLQTEIQFIESYYQLLKTRHGEAVQLQIELDKRYEHYLLPTLSLQMLMENAVKHNTLSKNKPLLIDIFTTTGNKLVVSNNLQPRTVKGPSNKIGLDNIKNKYQLLHHSGFQVLEDARTFSVVLPLIWSKAADEKLVLL